jgi:hypothetical protein
MPVAISNPTDTERVDLKTLEGGWVELRRMTFGQITERRALMKLSIASTKGSKDVKGEMAMANAEITRFEFRNCVVDHNLERTEGIKLNLASPVDFASLDPRVGQEIERLIEVRNNFEDADQEN